MLLAARQTTQRWELVRAAIVTFLLAELTAEVAKQAANQPRPLAVLPGIGASGARPDASSAFVPVLAGLRTRRLAPAAR